MATYYISPTGDNADDGSEATPWETMAYAYSNSTTGDTIHCLAGTYTMVSQNFATSRNVTGADAKTTIFDGGGAGATWTTAPLMNISNIHFTNIADSMILYISHKILNLTNCIVSDFSSAGYLKNPIRQNGSAEVNILGCLFYNIITTYPTVSAGYGTIINGNYGICSITNSTFYIVYNPATPNYAIPFGSAAYATTYTIKNNIFMNAGNTSILKSSSSIISEDSSNNCVYGYSSVPVMDDTVAEDPKMIDPSNGNFNLKNDSPCINKGILI